MRPDAHAAGPGHSGSQAHVLAGIAGRAVEADQNGSDLSEDIAALQSAGVLSNLTAACLPEGQTADAVALLRAIGRANLSVGRVVEGHVNARILIHLYGTAQQRQQAMMRDDLHAVWGADDDIPVQIGTAPNGSPVLQGQKKFCSGLGLVRRAIVTAKAGASPPQMVLVDATHPDRADVSRWQVSGMRATRSGRYDMTDLPAECLGQPGDYLREPHFDGGLWRYLALHVGGLEALAEETKRQLGERGTQPLQAARLVELAIAAQGARLWVEAAAKGAATFDVARILLARKAVETACLQGIALSEQALGTAAFVSGGRIDLIRRDLSFFLRQADLDGKTLRAAEALMRTDMAFTGVS